MRRLCLALLFAALAAPAGAATLADVTMPDQAQAGDQRLVLNGLGLRKKAFISVYVAGLYLPAKQRDAAAILAADGARRLDMHFVFGVGAGRMCSAWMEGLEANTPQASAAVKGQFDTLCSWMADMKDGDEISFSYLPGRGTSVTVKGQPKGSLEGKPFADALFACWIGSTPPSADFKKGLLGG